MPALDTQERIGIKLARVRVKRFTESEGDIPDGSLDELGYELGIGASLDIEAATVSIGIRIGVIKSDGESDEETLLDTEVVCIFALRDLAALRDDEGLVSLPRMLFASMVGIAFSTARGVIIGRSRISQLGDIPLPVVSPNAILESFLQDQQIDWVASS